MKIIGIVGTNTPQSYNRRLLEFIQKNTTDLFEIEMMEIDQIPLFNQNLDPAQFPAIQEKAQKIMEADGVIIATPEHNHTITAMLKSFLEWLSFKVHPFANKPVLIVGASYYKQGSSRAQLHLRQILQAPGLNAWVLPGNEFLLGNVKEAFDADNQLIDPKTHEFLRHILIKFKRFVEIISQFEAENE